MKYKKVISKLVSVTDPLDHSEKIYSFGITALELLNLNLNLNLLQSYNIHVYIMTKK